MRVGGVWFLLIPPATKNFNPNHVEIIMENQNSPEKVDLEFERVNAPEDNYGFSTSAADPIAYYKHKLIREYQIGPFRFENSILAIRSEEELAAFKALITHRNVPDSERAGIVEYHPELLARVERPLTASRGAQGTDSILDTKRQAGAPINNLTLNNLFKNS